MNELRNSTFSIFWLKNLIKKQIFNLLYDLVSNPSNMNQWNNFNLWFMNKIKITYLENQTNIHILFGSFRFSIQGTCYLNIVVNVLWE